MPCARPRRTHGRICGANSTSEVPRQARPASFRNDASIVAQTCRVSSNTSQSCPLSTWLANRILCSIGDSVSQGIHHPDLSPMSPVNESPMCPVHTGPSPASVKTPSLPRSRSFSTRHRNPRKNRRGPGRLSGRLRIRCFLQPGGIAALPAHEMRKQEQVNPSDP